MFNFDLHFDDVPIQLGPLSTEIYVSGVAHMLGDYSGASVHDITLAMHPAPRQTIERMLNRDSPVELQLYRLLAYSVEHHCADRIKRECDQRSGSAYHAETRREQSYENWRRV